MDNTYCLSSVDRENLICRMREFGPALEIQQDLLRSLVEMLNRLQLEMHF